ncbi:MAG: UDP-N-acetylglucosamine--N-acetylmuramyl-(pentapeptide) pyrophosphoryl-undecaprenol N-acetylglucosamine transferase [Puniceicoccales bacterium]|jgi:UDP-N-acetylglucosamine--N-acetylmuramyl-(pentapeptide) pyrophosphoryl-undecaprenol N-acetylglucosamine transferase|nr:UDP-N-acetylglucosamine--N-acetylmuramyl-(pentapeptide) pyrophosphoryl-undecaprenol N-acetylglucosamine transferase [Puniceicoccales bacterium]
MSDTDVGVDVGAGKLAVIACGGTGGHLTPGIALAEALRERGANSLLLTSRKSIDKRLLEKYPRLETLPAPGSGFSVRPAGFAKFLLNTLRGFLFARRLLRERRPSVFVSFGGFLTTGPALAFWLAGVPVVFHEANRVPGKAVRFLKKLATQIWLPPDVGMRGLREGVLCHAGFPVREEIKPLPKVEARRALGLPETGTLLLVTGGSQGAAVLNNWVRENLDAFAAAGAHVLCITGPGKEAADSATADGATADGVAEADGAVAAEVVPVVKFVPFCDKMAEALSAADVVVARAGAGSIAEFAACAVPSVLVPLPNAKDNHQDANARYLESLGGCSVVSQTQPAALTAEVLRLLADSAAREKQRDILRGLRPRFAWEPLPAAVAKLLEK